MDKTTSLDHACGAFCPSPGAEAGVPDALLLVPGAEPIAGYRLLERLGRGGFGEVWKASGPGGFLVALKFISLSGQAGPVELRALGVIKNIRHPHLLAMFGSWQVGDYLVQALELAERSLQDWFQEAVARGEVGIPVPEVVEALMDAARGIDYLNEPRHPSPDGGELLSIQHRDIKPQNLLLVGGSVKVADFGLARILRGTHTGHTGSLTPSFAAPEFFRNETSRHSDQYSLAVTYCLLRGGRFPFTGTIEQIVVGHLMHQPDLTMLPPPERAVVARALAKEPAERWPSCRTFVEQLCLQAVPTQHAAVTAAMVPATAPDVCLAATTESPARMVRPRPRRAGLLGTVAAGAAILAGIVLAVALHDRRRAPTVAARRAEASVLPGPSRPAAPRRIGEVRRFEGVGEPIACLAFAPDGRRVLSGDEGGEVWSWDADTGRGLLRLGRHSDRVSAVAFLPDGRRALTAAGLNPFFASGGAVRLWDLDAGAERWRFDGHSRRVAALAIAPDGRRALSGGDDGTLQCWDLDHPGERPVFSAHPGAITCLAIAPDGVRALSGGADGSVLLWDLRRGSVIHRFTGHRSGVLAVAFLADGVRAASASGPAPFGDESPSLRLWDAASSAELSAYDLPGATACVAFAPDGGQVLIGGDDGTLRLWEVAGGRERLRLDGHTGRVACVALAPDGRLALSGGDDGTLRLWRLTP